MAERSPEMPDPYDRLLGALHGLPDVESTKQTTMLVVEPLLGNSITYIVQTYRQAERGDTVFVQIVDKVGSVRIALPPKVANVIARQRDRLTKAIRKRTAKRLAQERKEAGIKPGFMRAKSSD
jgi:hypothetical protein